MDILREMGYGTFGVLVDLSEHRLLVMRGKQQLKNNVGGV